MIAAPSAREVERYGRGRRCAPPPPPPAGLGSVLLGPGRAPSVPQPPLSGMTLWLRASLGVTTNMGGGVTLWADQSGSGNDMSNAGGGPLVGSGIHGHTTLDQATALTGLQTTTTLATFITASAWSMYAVWLYTGAIDIASGGQFSPPIWQSKVEVLSATGIVVGQSGGHAQVGVYNNTSAARLTSLAPSVPHYVGAKLSSGTLFITADDGSTTSVSGQSPSGFLTLGASMFNQNDGADAFLGSCGEVILYNRATTSGEDTTIFNWFHSQWGI